MDQDPRGGVGRLGCRTLSQCPFPSPPPPPPQKMAPPPSTATDCGSKKGHMPPLCAICMLSDSFGPKEQCFGMLLGNRMPSPKVPLKSRRGVLCSMQNNCPRPPPPPNSTHTTQLKPPSPPGSVYSCLCTFCHVVVFLENGNLATDVQRCTHGSVVIEDQIRLD